MIEIVGDLDHATAHELRDFVARTGLRPGQLMVLDLARLEFCDSSGITALIAARNHAVAAGADVALAAVPANTLRVLRIVGLDQVFPSTPTRTRPPATAPPPRRPDSTRAAGAADDRPAPPASDPRRLSPGPTRRVRRLPPSHSRSRRYASSSAAPFSRARPRAASRRRQSPSAPSSGSSPPAARTWVISGAICSNR